MTFYPGASPEVVETDVTKPIEYAINTVSGVSLIRSNSHDGRSDVFAEFRMSTDMNRAMQDVRDKIATIRPGFASDVKDPLVLRVDQENQQPVVSLAVLSPTASLRDLTSLTDQTIVKALENVPGVARIDVNGRVTRQILVQIKPQALNSLGISVDQVANAIRAANQDVPAGRITRGVSDSIVRVEGKIKDPMQFARIIVAQQGGAPIYLSQVADIIDGEKDQDSIARINGRPSITLDLQKAQDAQHRRDRPRHQGRHRRAEAAPAGRRRAARHPVRRRRRRGERQPREADDHRGRAPHRADRVPVPAQLAQHGHHRAHAADRGHRDVHRASTRSASRSIS